MGLLVSMAPKVKMVFLGLWGMGSNGWRLHGATCYIPLTIIDDLEIGSDCKGVVNRSRENMGIFLVKVWINHTLGAKCN